MAGEQHQCRDDHDPGDAADRRRSERGDEGGHLVGNLAAHQQRRYAGGDLHHRQRHDEGGDADHREPERIDQAEHRAERQRQQDRRPAGHRDIGDVDVGFLRGEIGDRDARDVGDAGDRQVDLGAEDHEGEADGDDAGDRNLGQDVAEIVERRERRAGDGEEAGEAYQRQERREVAHLGAQHGSEPARPFAIGRGDCHAFIGCHRVSSRRFEQPVLADRLVAEFAHHRAALEDDDAIGERQHRFGLGREHDDGKSLARADRG